jgi:hypothetical protein
MMILFFCWWTAKTIAGSYMRVTMGDLLVWGQKLDPNLYHNTLGKLTSRAIHWYNNIVVILVLNHTLLIFEVQNVAGSYLGWHWDWCLSATPLK